MTTKANGQKRKHNRYDDEFRANAVLMLEAAGYPGKEGALTAVSRRLSVPARTLSRWFNKEQNPPPDRLVKIKKGELVEKLDDLAHMILDAMPGNVTEASLKEQATALGIVIDKKQLLSGRPTENHELTIYDHRTELLATVAGKFGGAASGRNREINQKPVA